MMTELSIEERLAAVEKAVTELQKQTAGLKAAPNWLERFRGSFKDEPDFDQVIEYGRAWRAGEMN